VDKYNRGNLTHKDAMPGTKILPGIIAKEQILKIEKFPYYDRLICLSGLSPGESIEKSIKGWLHIDELPKELCGIHEGEVDISVWMKDQIEKESDNLKSLSTSQEKYAELSTEPFEIKAKTLKGLANKIKGLKGNDPKDYTKSMVNRANALFREHARKFIKLNQENGFFGIIKDDVKLFKEPRKVGRKKIEK
jgi:hypothetical protein